MQPILIRHLTTRWACGMLSPSAVIVDGPGVSIEPRAPLAIRMAHNPTNALSGGAWPGRAFVSSGLAALAFLGLSVVPFVVRRPRLGKIAVGLVAIAWLWTGCTSAQTLETRKTSTRIEPREAIAILWQHPTGRPPDEARAVEDEFGRCVSETIHMTHPGLRIILPDEFRRTVFSYTMPESEARGREYLELLMNQPAIRNRMASLGIRYLISVGGETDRKSWEGGGIGSYAGAFGLWWVDRQSRLAASILDLKEARSAGELHATASGRPWFAIIGFIPLGLPAFTEARVCKDLGEALANFLAGADTPEPSGISERKNK